MELALKASGHCLGGLGFRMFSHSLINSLTHSFTHILNHTRVYSLTHSRTYCESIQFGRISQE